MYINLLGRSVTLTLSLGSTCPKEQKKGDKGDRTSCTACALRSFSVEFPTQPRALSRTYLETRPPSLLDKPKNNAFQILRIRRFPAAQWKIVVIPDNCDENANANEMRLSCGIAYIVANALSSRAQVSTLRNRPAPIDSATTRNLRG